LNANNLYLLTHVIIGVKKGCDNMGLADFERKKDEKINGVIYDMPPAPSFEHGIINNNIN
jgi:hypothetical protein